MPALSNRSKRARRGNGISPAGAPRPGWKTTVHPPERSATAFGSPCGSGGAPAPPSRRKTTKTDSVGASRSGTAVTPFPSGRQPGTEKREPSSAFQNSTAPVARKRAVPSMRAPAFVATFATK